ncbi:MAG: hypothetical protein H6818_21475 [Phycisphaerales bacterium]|nr:hypothetical protein [Phycisphaerales bacterium]MCB9862362.1 hypothetical protein [Phycisphaerales bacterium]
MSKQRQIRCEVNYPPARFPHVFVWLAAPALLFAGWFASTPTLNAQQPAPTTQNDATASHTETSQPLIADEPTPAPTPPTSGPASAPVPTVAAATIKPADRFGLWTLTPAIVAILIAIISRQVLLALPLGILTASAMMLYGTPAFNNPLNWFTYSIDRYLFGAIASLNDDGTLYQGHLKILIFTLFIGAMIGIIEANGGIKAMVARVTRHLATPRRGQLGAFFAGVVVFFDDYANTMIVGPSMRPIFDRLKLSREKLAYIVDSTAAPVASVFIGTWLVAEIGFIDDGLKVLGSDRPEFLVGMTGFTAFWASLPYRTYAWLALAMVFIIAVTGRDFGGMLTAESRAVNAPDDESSDSVASADHDRAAKKWWLGALPIAILIFGTIGLLFGMGYYAFHQAGEQVNTSSFRLFSESIGTMLDSTYVDSANALLYAAFTAAILALLISTLSRACTLAQAMDGMMEGMKRMFAACVVLTLAWGLTRATDDLQLSEVAARVLKTLEESGRFDTMFLPTATFITAAIVSFATGTSWGTMGILCPTAVAISAQLYAGMPQADALPLFYSTIGAVLTGAVFGDHCSPISDTTVMSSIASECDHGRHVWTQMPYAFVVAIVGLLTTDILYYALSQWMPALHDSIKHWFVYPGTLLGIVVLTLIVLIVGRRPKRLEPTPVRPDVLETSPTNS